jgi:hypothetical protein
MPRLVFFMFFNKQLYYPLKYFIKALMHHVFLVEYRLQNIAEAMLSGHFIVLKGFVCFCRLQACVTFISLV